MKNIIIEFNDGIIVKRKKPSQLTTEQKLALLEVMGIPVNEFHREEIIDNGTPSNPHYSCPLDVTLREFIERGK